MQINCDRDKYKVCIRPYLCKLRDVLQPEELSLKLLEVGCITLREKEEIGCIQKQQGTIRAASHLLTDVFPRAEGWFDLLLDWLINRGHTDLANSIVSKLEHKWTKNVHQQQEGTREGDSTPSGSEPSTIYNVVEVEESENDWRPNDLSNSDPCRLTAHPANIGQKMAPGDGEGTTSDETCLKMVCSARNAATTCSQRVDGRASIGSGQGDPNAIAAGQSLSSFQGGFYVPTEQTRNRHLPVFLLGSSSSINQDAPSCHQQNDLTTTDGSVGHGSARSEGPHQTPTEQEGTREGDSTPSGSEPSTIYNVVEEEQSENDRRPNDLSNSDPRRSTAHPANISQRELRSVCRVIPRPKMAPGVGEGTTSDETCPKMVCGARNAATTCSQRVDGRASIGSGQGDTRPNANAAGQSSSSFQAVPAMEQTRNHHSAMPLSGTQRNDQPSTVSPSPLVNTPGDTPQTRPIPSGSSSSSIHQNAPSCHQQNDLTTTDGSVGHGSARSEGPHQMPTGNSSDEYTAGTSSLAFIATVCAALSVVGVALYISKH